MVDGGKEEKRREKGNKKEEKKRKRKREMEDGEVMEIDILKKKERRKGTGG